MEQADKIDRKFKEFQKKVKQSLDVCDRADANHIRVWKRYMAFLNSVGLSTSDADDLEMYMPLKKRKRSLVGIDFDPNGKEDERYTGLEIAEILTIVATRDFHKKIDNKRWVLVRYECSCDPYREDRYVVGGTVVKGGK